MRRTRPHASLLTVPALAAVAVLSGFPVHAHAQAPCDPSQLVLGDTAYRRAGAIVPFDPGRMVQVGRQGGVPIYADTTVEPWSQLLLPASGGWLQPFERLREGALAGTSGSRLPSFPVAVDTERREANPVGMAGAPPARAVGQAWSDRSGCPAVDGPSAPRALEPAADAASTAAVPAAGSLPLQRPAIVMLPLAAPQGNRGVWVGFAGAVWRAEGTAIPLKGLALTEGGLLGTRRVLVSPDRPDAICLSLRDGTVTRFSRAQ